MKTRILVAAAVLVSAIIHFEQWFLVFSDNAVIGPAMLVNFGGGIIIVIALLTWRYWLPLAVAVLFGAATLASFLVSATVGLFGVHEHWTIWEAYVAALAEIVAIIAGAIGWSMKSVRGRASPRRRRTH